MRGGDHFDFAGDSAEFVGAAAIDADALFDDPLAHNRLGDRPDGVLDLSGCVGVFCGELCQFGDDRLVELCFRGLSLGLVCDLLRVGDAFGGCGLHCREDLVAVVDAQRRLHLGDLSGGVDRLLLQLDHLADPGLARFEASCEHVLVDFGGARLVQGPRVSCAAGLDHHHRDVVGAMVVAVVVAEAAGDHHLEGRFGGLLVGGEGNPLAVRRPAHADCSDRAVERDRRQAQCQRGGVESQDVVGVLLVGAEYRAHDMDLVAEAVGEGGTQRPVDQATGEYRLLPCSGFTAEERAGNLPGGVHPLLDVYCQREEVGALAGS